MSITVITASLEDIRQIVREEVARATQTHAQEPAGPRYLTTEEAAQIARKSPETIRDWIRSGRLRALPRSGRQHYQIRPEDLEQAIVSPPDAGPDEWARGILRRIG